MATLLHVSITDFADNFSRIPIHERVELPEEWIPADSRVEIDAKITAGMQVRRGARPAISD